MTFEKWLGVAAALLREQGFESPELDAEIILAHTISHPRTYLHAHADEVLDARHEEIANARIDLRLDHVPIAYVIGHKEFYGNRFDVTTATLVPRPESEQILELLGEWMPNSQALSDVAERKLVDIGTGTGCLGISAKLSHPELSVTLIDTSRPALEVAKRNARKLDADVEAMQSNLLDAYPYSPDIVLANLPYVDETWQRSEETEFEPAEALFAGHNGLSIIEDCFSQLSSRMRTGGVAIFEADPRQWDAILVTAKKACFALDKKNQFAARFLKD